MQLCEHTGKTLNNTLKFSLMGWRNSCFLGKTLFECHQHVHVCQLNFTTGYLNFHSLRTNWIKDAGLITGPSGTISIGILRIQLGIEFFKGINTCRAVKAHGGCTDTHTGSISLTVSEETTVLQNYLMPSLNIQWPSQCFHVGESTAA